MKHIFKTGFKPGTLVEARLGLSGKVVLEAFISTTYITSQFLELTGGKVAVALTNDLSNPSGFNYWALVENIRVL